MAIYGHMTRTTPSPGMTPPKTQKVCKQSRDDTNTGG